MPTTIIYINNILGKEEVFLYCVINYLFIATYNFSLLDIYIYVLLKCASPK